jgi:hypothetical protein
MPLRFLALSTLLIISGTACAQTTDLPKIKGYFSIVHPIVSFSSEKPGVNFRDYYVVGFPTGINIWKSETIGFSFELTPFIRLQDGQSKTSSLMFHPGLIISLGEGYTFTSRLAFETSGRYGATAIFGKTFYKAEAYGLFAAMPLPVRFGNDQPVTFAPGIQIGVSF